MAICTTILLLAALSGELPAGSCALKCELKKAIVGVETPTTGRAMLGDGSWIPAYRFDDKWYWITKNLPEQCARGGATKQ